MGETTGKRAPSTCLLLAAAVALGSTAARAAENAASPERFARLQAVSPVSDEFLRRTQDATQTIPAHVWSGLHQAGWSVKLAQFVTDADPALRGAQPRGWPEGSTWENTDAVHLPAARTLVFAEKRRDRAGRVVESTRIEGVLRHEIGHAFDQASGRGAAMRSSTPAFLAAYVADARRIPALDRGQLGYYLQRGAAGRQETFAEAFAILLGGGSDEPHRETFARSFPSVLAQVQQSIDEFAPPARIATRARRR
jgi:hypothetical protein